MKRLRLLTGFGCVLFSALCGLALAQAPADSAQQNAEATTAANNTAAAAAVATGHASVGTPDFLEHLVDAVLQAFDIHATGNTVTHYAIAAGFLFGAFLLRHLVTVLLFGVLKRFASRTETTLDDKLFSRLERPVSSLVVVVGAFMAIKVLKLSPSADQALAYAYTIAFSFVVFWIFLRAFNTVLDHLQDVAIQKQLGIAAFMPWIKKTLIAIVVVFGALMIAQNLGADVKAFLTGLGIGGLAFALAAQDTLANVFGSVVVATDQPFKIGEFVRIGGSSGLVEDIGLRSTRLRTVDKALLIIPNKTVASETIVNLSRFTQRRVEMTLNYTYDTTPEQLEAVVEETRRILLAEKEIKPASVIVQFNNMGASSLDVWVVFETLDPDFAKHLLLKQRIMLAIMRMSAARGLSFAFPSQTLYLQGLAQLKAPTPSGSEPPKV